jgi:hypothetical protein
MIDVGIIASFPFSNLHRPTLQETAASPSAKCTRGRPQNTRGSLPRVQHSGKSLRGCPSRERGLPRVPKIVHSGKPSPSAILPLGDDLTPLVPSPFFLLFPECNTRGRNFLFFILKPLPRVQHSGKKFIFFFKTSSPSAHAQALGEAPFVFLKK